MCVYDVEPIAPPTDEIWNQLWRILQVAVDNHDCVTRGRLQSRERSHRLPESTREAKHLDTSVALMQIEDQCLGSIRRRVHTEDQLPVHPHAIEHAAQTVVDP